MSYRRTSLAVVIGSMLFASACGSGTEPVATTSPTPTATASASPTPTRSPQQRSSSPSPSSPQPTPKSEGTGAPMLFEPDPTLLIEASVTPACAREGDLVTLRVETEPETTVAFQAIYSNGRSGAEAFGGDYGGNAGGPTDERGVYTNSWVLKNSPPPGSVRVDIYVFSHTTPGHNNYAEARFEVAPPGQDCG